MARIKGRNTGPERSLGKALARQGLSFERQAKDLPGCPDLVFRRKRIAVFVDGNFWHGWRFPAWKHKLSSTWQMKIAKTRRRDQSNFRRLRSMGWEVIRIWEHQVEQNVDKCVLRITAKLTV